MPSEEDVIELSGRVAKILLENGAETSRVEGTAEYIGRAAGLELSCHATMTAVFVDAQTEAHTHLIKVRTGDFNLQKVDEINSVSRQFVAGHLSFDDLQRRIAAIDRKVIDFTWVQKIIGAGLVSIAPMLLFKATWGDLAWAFGVGIAGYLAAQWVGHQTKTPYITSAVGGFTIAVLAVLLVHLDWAVSSDNIIISALMPLVPGVALTNSLRELIGKHTISGMVRAVDAILVAVAIGGGVVLGSVLVQLVMGA
ncbi:threonine/serine exporter family protein [Lacticaseibacillus thailandensis]|nr:threonine/serine exporter family protein [Lacticaseibacillus thailandensis]